MSSARKSRNVNKRFSKVAEELQDKDSGNPSKKTKKRKLSDMLGSQWSRDELERFYEAYRKHGRDWRKIAVAVRNRSPEMLEALYNMNKAYLSLPEGHATATGLIAMMTDHYNILECSDSEQESYDASRISRKTPKRGRGKFRLMSKGSDGPYPDLLQYPAASLSYGCLSLLKKKRSGDLFAGSRPRAVGKRTPRIPVPFFFKEDRNMIASHSKQGLKSGYHAADDEGVHVAALALAEASQRGGSPQISRTPSRRHIRHSPVPIDKKIGESKFINGQIDEDHLEGSLGSREAENGEFFKDASTTETRQKAKKVHGKRSKAVEDDPYDDDREACSGTEEGLSVRKAKNDIDIDVTGGRPLRPSRGSKKRSRQLFFGDESSALDALQTLADLSLNILLPASTVESEASIQVKEESRTTDVDEKPNMPESLSTNLPNERPKTVERKEKGHSTAVDGVTRKGGKLSKGSTTDSKASSETKRQNGSSNNKVQKRKSKSMIEKASKSQFENDPQKSGCHRTEVVIEDGKRSSGKVKRVCQISMQPKFGKSVKLQEQHSTASDLGRVVADSNERVLADSAQNELIFPSKSRNRRKMDLQKALVGKETKSCEIYVEELSDKCTLSNRPYNLKETLCHCFSSRLSRRWCKFEWFYSAIDYPWFAKSEFVEYLNHVRLGHIPRLTRVEWGVIRSSLGKPRRLSDRFLQQEREKLEQYRESVRTHYAELRSGIREGLPTDLARPLSVGQRVIACHPRTREIHDGSILTVDRTRCRVQFDRPELGVEFVTDIDCMPMNPVENIPEALRKQNLVINKFCNGFSDLRLDEQKELKTRDSLAFASNENLEAADGASHVTYSYPMNTLMNQAKGDTLDAIVQAKAAVNEVAVAAQQAILTQPFTLAQIQAREADIRALADLSRTLDKKEALLIELRQMNEEVSAKQKNGDHIKDSENFRKQYAMVLLQLRDVNEQVASALLFLRQRNTYEKNSTLPWNKSNETSVQQSSFNSSALATNDSGSNVIEVIQNSRQKAKTMVDLAVQAMCSLKDGEDAYVRIGEALDLASNRNSGASSTIAAGRNNFADASHDNTVCQDQGSSKLESAAVQAPCLKFQSSSGNEVHYPSELISSCVATLFMIQMCTEKPYPPAEVAQILDCAVASLQPCCPQNVPIFREIETCMGIIKNQMLALVPTPSTVPAASDAPIL